MLSFSLPETSKIVLPFFYLSQTWLKIRSSSGPFRRRCSCQVSSRLSWNRLPSSFCKLISFYELDALVSPALLWLERLQILVFTEHIKFMKQLDMADFIEQCFLASDAQYYKVFCQNFLKKFRGLLRSSKIVVSELNVVNLLL